LPLVVDHAALSVTKTREPRRGHRVAQKGLQKSIAHMRATFPAAGGDPVRLQRLDNCRMPLRIFAHCRRADFATRQTASRRLSFRLMLIKTNKTCYWTLVQSVRAANRGPRTVNCRRMRRRTGSELAWQSELVQCSELRGVDPQSVHELALVYRL